MNEFSRKDFIEKLRSTRKSQNMTQEEFSAKIGIKRNTYARYETDALPNLLMFYKICKALSVSADYLLEPIGADDNESDVEEQKAETHSHIGSMSFE